MDKIHIGVHTSCMHINVEQVMLAKIFQSGNSQAVRLPKEFRFNVSEVEIFKRGDEIILKEKAKGLARAFELLTEMPSDFMENGRDDGLPQERLGL